jgi:hypothetical protein
MEMSSVDCFEINCRVSDGSSVQPLFDFVFLFLGQRWAVPRETSNERHRGRKPVQFFGAFPRAALVVVGSIKEKATRAPIETDISSVAMMA